MSHSHTFNTEQFLADSRKAACRRDRQQLIRLMLQQNRPETVAAVIDQMFLGDAARTKRIVELVDKVDELKGRVQRLTLKMWSHRGQIIDHSQRAGGLQVTIRELEFERAALHAQVQTQRRQIKKLQRTVDNQNDKISNWSFSGAPRAAQAKIERLRHRNQEIGSDLGYWKTRALLERKWLANSTAQVARVKRQAEWWKRVAKHWWQTYRARKKIIHILNYSGDDRW